MYINNFNKNKYSVEEEVKIINNIDKNACSKHALNNNYKGFKYYGDKNKCKMFNSDNFNNSISINNDYKIKSFIKTKDIIDFNNIYDQTDSYKFFEEINYSNKIPDNLINEKIVENEKDCINSCLIDNEDCKSIVYLDQPPSCVFYNNKKFKDKKESYENYDIYTIKNKNEILMEDSLEKPISSINVISLKNETNDLINSNTTPLYNCSGLYSTNPFCTSEFDPDRANFRSNYINYTNCISDIDLDFNKECKKKYGNEYKFDNNIFNMNTIVDCNNGGKRVKCKLDFDDFIEKFENNNIKNNIIYLSIFLFIFIFIVFLIYKILAM